MLPERDQFTQSFPCSVVVFQFYTRRGIDSTFMALYQSFMSRSEVNDVPLPEKLSKTLHVPVSREKAFRNKGSISNLAAIELNHAFELIVRDLIRGAFIDELESCRRNDVKFRIKPLIEDVLERMGFTEEAKSFDSVKKDLQRFCKAEGIDYNSEKKVRKPVPKLRATCANCAKEVSDGVSLDDFASYKGISRRTFFRKYRGSIRTFFHRGCLFIHLSELPEEAVSFTVPK